jgi:hypothetical protein
MMADTQLPLRATRPNLFQLVADLRGIAPSSRGGRAVPVHLLSSPRPGPLSIKLCEKGHVMSKPENDANNIFRPSDSPLTEYEKKQIALRKNLERLRAERLAREAANAGHSPKQKDRRSDRRSFR